MSQLEFTYTRLLLQVAIERETDIAFEWGVVQQW
jgi:hypothetical protein